MTEKIEKSLGRIVDVRKVDQPYGVIVQGEEAKKWRNGYGCTGGNGTYKLWEGSGVNHFLFVDVSVYANQNHKTSIDIRDMALNANGRLRVTSSFVDVLKSQNVGKKVQLYADESTGWRWCFANPEELNLIV